MICLQYSPNNKYLATGGNDVNVNLFSTENFSPIRSYSELSWPVRTLGFSYDSNLIASASEDHFIDISLVEGLPGQKFYNKSSQILNGNSYADFTDRFEMGDNEFDDEFNLYSNKILDKKRLSSSVFHLETGVPVFCLKWHPKAPILAYAADENYADGAGEGGLGSIRCFGIDQSKI